MRFTTAAQLVNALTEAKNQSELTRLTHPVDGYKLIMMDDMAYVAMPEAAAELWYARGQNNVLVSLAVGSTRD